MFPLRDENRSFSTPHVNRLLIAANVIVFLVFWLSALNVYLDSALADSMAGNATPGTFVLYPIDILRGQRLYTLFTAMFMHDPSSPLAGALHLFGNMIFLYVFGDNVEDTFGHVGYLGFYLLSGLVASFAQIMSSLYLGGLDVGVVGASGAISGVLGAYIVLYPKARILTLVFLPFPILVPIPSILFLGFWFVQQWLLGFFDIGGGVAYWAHIGGFIAGMVLAVTIGLKMKKARQARYRL